MKLWKSCQYTGCPTKHVRLCLWRFLNKGAIKDKIWWYHWIPCWILSMIKYKNLFLAEKITQLWPFSQEASILTNCVWGLILGVCLFMPLMKMLITWLFFQLEKCFYTFSCTEFNEEFSGTIRFYLLTQLCWENVQKQTGTCCEILKTFSKLNQWYLNHFELD